MAAYNVKWENGEVVLIEVDGIQYENPDQIPDPEDRARILYLMAQPPPPGVGPLDFIFPLFLAIGVLMLAISAISAFNTVRHLGREKSAEGQVVDLTVRRAENGNEFYYPVVRFALPNETVETVQLSEGSWPPAYEVGDVITVLYDRDAPRKARIDSASSAVGAWAVPLITGVLGVVFVVAMLFVRWIFQSDSELKEGA